jgi:copper chaperone CopZ
MNSKLKTLRFNISGMHCTSCALTIDLDLEEIPGVKSAKTNYAKSITEVEYDPGQVSQENIIAAIAKTGYQVY